MQITATSTQASIRSDFEKLRGLVPALRKENISLRKERIKLLRKWIHANRSRIHLAAYNDFRKPALEVDGVEIFHVLNEISHALEHLDEWAQPKKIDAPFTMLGTRSSIHFEPKGLCLIISPWNYPFSLAVGPLVSALAAGNAVIIKPSEMTPNVSRLLKEMASEVFVNGEVKVIEGAVDTASSLLELPFDHIFFTGSPGVGKVVMKAAAEHLTSVTLELGGKSPTIVTASANQDDAAQRIAVAKFINNGQTCIAPDYILVEKKVEQIFTEKLIRFIRKHFEGSEGFAKSGAYCRIVNQKHFNRINDLLQDALSLGAKIEMGGNTQPEDRFFPPVVLSNVAANARILEEEIFGPIVPVISFQTLQEAIDIINSKPKPLALYIFSGNKKEQQLVLKETSSGGVCINDSAIHFLHQNLPFGGVNNSGIGKSHGHYGFLAFSNEKPVLKQKSGRTTIQMFYPPYTKTSQLIMDWFLKLF